MHQDDETDSFLLSIFSAKTDGKKQKEKLYEHLGELTPKDMQRIQNTLANLSGKELGYWARLKRWWYGS